MLEMGKGLVKKGHDVTYLILGDKNYRGKNLKIESPKNIGRVKIIYTRSLPYSLIKNPNALKGVISLIFYFIFKIPKLFYFSLKNNIIHLSKPLPFGAVSVLIIKFFSGKKFVLDLDDLEGIGGFATINQKGKTFNKLVISFFEEFMPKKADAVTVVSKFLERKVELLDINRNKIFYVPNGADIKKFKSKRKNKELLKELNCEGKKIIGYVGRFGFGGINWDMLLDTFKIINDKDKKTKLLIVGGGQTLDKAKEYVKKLEIDKKVIFTGNVSRDSVPEYISIMDICLVPYSDEFPHTFINRSRSSIKLYEYMAMGKAIVATDIGEIHEALKDDCGALVKSNNPKDYAEKILELLKKPKLIEKYSKNVLKKVRKNYNYDNLCKIFENAYKFVKKESKTK